MKDMSEYKTYRDKLQEQYQKIGCELLDANTAIAEELRVRGLLWEVRGKFSDSSSDDAEEETLAECEEWIKIWESKEDWPFLETWQIFQGGKLVKEGDAK